MSRLGFLPTVSPAATKEFRETDKLPLRNLVFFWLVSLRIRLFILERWGRK